MIGARVRETGWATAVAHPNIALVKYWGKRDESWILPVNGSLSMTLDIFPTTTTVRVDPSIAADIVSVDGRSAPRAAANRVSEFLDLVRTLADSNARAMVDTVNTVPTGAGLASSASGFAALAMAAAHAYGLALDRRDLSRLARRGSGSACRSVYGGFVEWHAGRGTGCAGNDSSYAEQIDATSLDAAMVIALVDHRPKPVPSRIAMRHTAATSPLYRAWVESCTDDLARIRAAIAAGDLGLVGRIAEHNALGMHATMLAARPAVRYLLARSLAVLDRIVWLRECGVAVHATVDAGPNVVALCGRADADEVAAALGELGDDVTTHVAAPGPPATLLAGDPR
ncbi:diphosphomevalonate decarboxylase [Nocardia sp. CDC159]|uniref:diphosphomevalonate decarboxylase n=1 Tax=Nocardia pulmonis TaxID=2951408 RepID=A0A9X2J128_9NOCA|nr:MULTISPECIES: diphosphomevalonate decarboxylase [Nocardia]MCM6778449.1 diphosphomevalonate decarboxylase [Nocardia pulmonis]MCM6791338.1 diphosphomevalonate decarboxylase [Nocardia sp. CDC159]